MSATVKFIEQARAEGLTVLTRGEWGSRPDGRPWPLAPDVSDVYQNRREKKPHARLPMRPVGTVWQHISVTEDSGDLTGDFRQDMQTVERIGFQRFGSGFSYNIAVDMTTGMVGIGQPLDAKGTHTVMRVDREGFTHDQNAVALAIVVIGGCDDKLSAKAERSIVLVLVALVRAGLLTPHFDYKPHNFADPGKACPCPTTHNRMDEIYMAVQKELNTPGPTRITIGRGFLESARAVLWEASQANSGARKAAIVAALTSIRAALAVLPKR